jgi:Fe2+ or Zn2+ uptake regulation protein
MRNIRNYYEQVQPLTRQRKLLLNLIRDAGGHIDAKELFRRASIEDPSISLATVYRNLGVFKELGLLKEHRLGQVRCYYELSDSGDHEHVVCQGCGKVIEFEVPLLRRLIREMQRKLDFEVTKAELYLEGYCRECGEGKRKRSSRRRERIVPSNERG